VLEAMTIGGDTFKWAQAQIAQQTREELAAKRDTARQKAEAAKAAAKIAIDKRKNPPPDYFVAPDETGDPEVDARATLDAVSEGFRARMRDEANRFRDSTDSEFWFAVCFQSREQKEAFLGALKVLLHGDKYVDGQVLAEALGIALPKADVRYNDSSKASSWAQFS
jgi:hypothetical protein